MDMLDMSETLHLLPIFFLGFGLAALLAAPLSRWWQKRSNVLLTWIWMILFTIGSGIVMLVLLLLPFQRKHNSIDAEAN
jgi:mannose/fructose/N-acetylgalactosamine-specific phosphotransferase system component IIC